MKAAMYYGKNDIRIENIKEPTIYPGAVKIAPRYNGICGSDVHLFYDGVGGPVPTIDSPHPITGECLPIVFGHEFSGIVEEVAPDVKNLKVGDRVTVEPLIVDDTCPACVAGDYNICENVGFRGISGRGGGLSEHVVVEERWVHKVNNMPLDVAAMIEPLAVALHAVQHCGIKQGCCVLVGGAGPIGLLTAAVLKAKGVLTIITDTVPSRREKAQQTGVADIVLDPMSDDVETIVRHETKGRGADYAFDAAGSKVAFAELMRALAPGGRIEVIAVHTETVEIDLLSEMVMHEHVIGSSLAYANTFPDAIALVNSGGVDLKPFITSVIPMHDLVSKGLHQLKTEPTEIKILIDIHL